MLLVDDANANRVYKIKILNYDAVLEDEKRSDLLRFQDEWERLEDRFQKPHWYWQAEDYGIAKKLLKKYGYDLLASTLVDFWLYFAGPLNEGYQHPVRLFASSISKIEAEGYQ